MESQQEVVNQLKREYELYARSGGAGPFQPSSTTAIALGKLVRALETKRQLGNLTTQENHWLKTIDELLEKISNLNQQKRSAENITPVTVSQPQVYNLQSGKLTEEEDEIQPFFVPHISEEEADKIISTLNQQFEEKVLKKLKSRPNLDTPRSDAPDFSPPQNAVPEGRNLGDYLEGLRMEKPSLPFADEDSQKDLSRFAKNHG